MADKEHTDPERMEKIVSLAKRRGFIYQSAELYGGLNGCWDYGPLGAELKRNVKDYWWRKNVQERDDIVGLDGSILTHQAILTASGHVGGFSDPMVDCKTCKSRFRADNLDDFQMGGGDLGLTELSSGVDIATHVVALSDTAESSVFPFVLKR